MGRILWDGTNIVIDAFRLDVDKLNNIAKKYNAKYVLSSNTYLFKRNKNVILELAELKNTVQDESFVKLVNLVNMAEKKRQERIDSLGFPDFMYPFQKETVYQMVNMTRNVLLAAAMGSGKTLMSLLYLSKAQESYPALIVCPASLKLNWANEVQKWTPEKSVYVISGRDSYKDDYVINQAQKADIIIINYDILGVDDKEAMKREKERIQMAKENGWRYRKAFIPVKGWAQTFVDEFKLKTIICDECQYIESSKAVRTRAVIQTSANQNIKKIFLSGTPFETRVKQFYNACHILAPDIFPKEYDFLNRYCGPKYNGFGWTYDGASNIPELREKLSYFMIRLKKEDILPQLPPKQNIPIYFDMDKKARQVYDQMEEELLSQDEGVHQFAYLAKMKEALVEIKLDAVIQFIKDMMEVEEKLVIFTYHNTMYDTLMSYFKGQCAGINGGVATDKRQKEVDKFQNDDKIRLFIGQIQAASTGITLTAAHTVIFTEWGQTVAQHLQAQDRVHRIGQTADRCISYYLVVKDTVDESPLSQLSNHHADIEAVLDGNMNAEFVEMDNLMIAKVKERRLMNKKKGVRIEYD